ncbi:nitroreductase family protein [Streptosporangium sp. NPDC006007]|uniref:nitroreductase family protein n=1 Tax=Streptosporangium sp. NPDC006007 TaxID=3154575 RepID=UPI0033A6ECD3
MKEGRDETVNDSHEQAGHESAGEVPLLGLSADELLMTTRTVRRRLDLTRPVPRAVIRRAVEIAVQAPTGGNRAGWRWIVVDDPALRAEVGRVWSECAEGYLRHVPADDRMLPGARHLQRIIGSVPALVIPVIEGRPPERDLSWTASFWGSILPAMWSFMLALRARGLGGAWTQVHLRREQEMAELLGIPHGEVTQAGLVPVAWTVGTTFKPARREPVEEILHWNEW